MIRRIACVFALAVCATAITGCIEIRGTGPGMPGSVEVTSAESTTAQPVTRGVVTEKLTYGPWVVTVESARRVNESVGGAMVPSGADLLVVDVGFQNNGTEALTVDPRNFRLLGEDGTAYPFANTTQASFNAGSMRPVQARYGTSTTFVFEVPKGSDRFDLVFLPQGEGGAELAWRVP
jgi:hypothetical protein